MSVAGLIDFVLLGMLTVTAIAIARQRNLLASAMLAGIFSLLGACWMLLLNAPDVAFTEAAVGAGISTIIFLATLCVTPSEEKPSRGSPFGLLVVTATGGLLVYGTLDMPPIGDPEAPANTSEVTAVYLQSAEVPAGHGDDPHGSLQPHAEYAVGIPNTVTTVLASFRGYDTMGETAVVFTAGLGVVAILAGARHRRYRLPGDEDELR